MIMNMNMIMIMIIMILLLSTAEWSRGDSRRGTRIMNRPLSQERTSVGATEASQTLTPNFVSTVLFHSQIVSYGGKCGLAGSRLAPEA